MSIGINTLSNVSLIIPAKPAIIQTVWGFGYRLSDTGMAQVTAILDGVA